MSVPAPSDESITLPQRPVRSPPSPFPVMAAMAPVFASVIIWLVTRSPFALMFAALGPVIAIASVVDSRWSSGRRLKKDLAAHAVELERVAGLIDVRLDEERRSRNRARPSARSLLDEHSVAAGDGAAGTARFGRWRVPESARTRVVIGTGTLRSGLRVEGAIDSDAARALRERARRVSGVPVDIDAVRGIGIIGAPVLARACARGIVVQLCNAIAPDTATVRAESSDWEWIAQLPHAESPRASLTIQIIDNVGAAATPVSIPVEARDSALTGSASTILLVVAESVEQIPTSCRTVLEITGPGPAVLHGSSDSSAGGEPPDAGRVSVDFVTVVECDVFARGLAELAGRLGLTDHAAELPLSVAFRDAHKLAVPVSEAHDAAGSTLSAVLGVESHGAAVVDIVRDGPHAIVGGTTGSGKSELLVTWVASMALRHPPRAVTFLLVDFKGGSAFAPLQSLPHVVGVLTDLNDVAATRALASLSAEVLYRERTLSELGCRDIGETGGAFPRLVIVVDEFAAMLDGFSELSALFVDIAARGRSLGMHLILCTQRPAGVVKDSLLANCGLRMSLRVHNRSDSIAVVGTDAAATLPATQPGRLVLASGGTVRRVQVATVSQVEIDDIARSAPLLAPVRRPWLDPLPSWLALTDLEQADGIRLGRADLPALQRQDVALWRPERDGSVLVVGAARTGKTTLLDTVTVEATALSAGAGRWTFLRVGGDDEETWDVVTGLAAQLRSTTARWSRTILAVDDLDSLIARLDDDYATRLRDAVVELLRDGPRRSVWLMITAQRLAGPLGMLTGFAGASLVLRVANRQEHILIGGEGTTWVANRPPGNATWRGATIQIAVAPTDDADTARPNSTGAVPLKTGSARHRRNTTAADYDFREHSVTMVVCPSPQRRAEALLAANRERPGLVPVRIATLGGVARLTVAELGLDQPGPIVLIGDGDEWQGQWALFAALRQSADLIVDGCTVSEYRSLTKRRELPPLLATPGHAWHLSPGGQAARVRLV